MSLFKQPLVLFASILLIGNVYAPSHAHAQDGQAGSVKPLTVPQQTAPNTDGIENAFPTAATEPAMPEVLRNAVKTGAQAKYLGEFNGLNGWVLVKGGKPEFHYVTKDGNAIIMGILFDRKGNMITGEQLRVMRLSDGASTYKLSDLSESRRQNQTSSAGREAAPEASPTVPAEPKSKAELFYDAVEDGNWLRMGAADAPYLYAFIDPDCSHCHRFLEDIRTPYLDSGLVQIRVLPVGFNEVSLKKASYLLAAPRPQEQLYAHIEGDSEALFVPGDINTEGATKNIAILSRWKVEGTPVITYKDRQGVVRFVRGAPDNVAVIVDELER